MDDTINDIIQDTTKIMVEFEFLEQLDHRLPPAALFPRNRLPASPRFWDREEWEINSPIFL